MNPRVQDRSPHTIRLVADVPAFGQLYLDSALSPRMAARLWSIAEIIYDDAINGAADELVGQLPPLAQLHADDMFRTAFVSRFAVIAKRLASGLDDLEAIATCTADEMAVHMVVASARVLYQVGDPDWIELLPARPDDDEDFEWLIEVLLQDTDVLLLFDPALDGIEDPGTQDPMGGRLVNLHPNDWFKPFPNAP